MMTLTELLPAIKQLSPLDKIKLIRLLAEEMESREKIAPLEPGKAYNLPTPYNSFGAGAILMQVIESIVLHPVDIIRGVGYVRL